MSAYRPEFCRVLYVILLAVALAAAARAAEPFSVVLLPDTQNYAENYPDTYKAQTAWIASRVKPDNLRFVIHLGDIVQTAAAEKEWKVADAAHKQLDGVVPYSVVPGNHDMDHAGDDITRKTALYNKYFPPSRFEGNAWYGGHKGEDNVNNYCFFEGGGMKFMVLNLESAPSAETLAWAQGVLEAHPEHRVILATHFYLRPEGRVPEKRPYGLDGAGPEQLWNNFIRKQKNIFMVVCGHVLGVHHQTSVNDFGAGVHEILCDYQGEDNGGNGWLQTMRFVPDENKICVEAYSPTLKQDNPAPPHSYVLDYKMAGGLAQQ